MQKSLLHFISLVFAFGVKAQIINTIAGVPGSSGFSGDGGPATAAKLSGTRQITVDKKGDLFIVDHGNGRIRKINHNTGIITTIAGTGSYGSYGDGGSATAAGIGVPFGICFDKHNNMFISSGGGPGSYNNNIRKVDSMGVITTVAGVDTSGFSGDGGPATAAKLNGPTAVATDNVNLYIGDRYNDRIRKVDRYGIISTIYCDSFNVCQGNEDQISCINEKIYGGCGRIMDTLGNFVGTTPAQEGVLAADKAGNLYALGFNCVVRIDKYNNRRVVAGDSTISGYSGDGGIATAASFYFISGVTIDTTGNLYVADASYMAVRKVNLCGSPVTNYTLGPSGTPQVWNVNPNYSFMATDAKWSWGDGTYTMGFYPSHAYSAAGKYNICVTAYNLCGDSSVYCQNDSIYRDNGSFIYVNILDPHANNGVGISQLPAFSGGFQIYPSPVSSLLHVTDLKRGDAVKVFDVLGNEMEVSITGDKDNEKVIDTNPLVTGVYFIRACTITRKFIVQH